MVRRKEAQAEYLAKILDTALSIPGFRARFGLDPLVGLVPVVGDTIATIGGAAILIIARQLNVPWEVQIQMAYNLFKNGLIGSVPFVGDLYSFSFKSHQLNAALLIRSIKHGVEGSCPLSIRTLTLSDVLILAVLIVPIVLLVLVVGIWFYDHNFSLLTLVFPPLYQSRTE